MRRSSDRARFVIGLAVLFAAFMMFLLPLIGSLFAPMLFALAGFLVAVRPRSAWFIGAAVAVVAALIALGLSLIPAAHAGHDALLRPSDTWYVAVWLIATMAGPYVLGVGVGVLVARDEARKRATGAAAVAGWYPDPGQAHALRYWNGRDWTQWVSDVDAGSGHG